MENISLVTDELGNEHIILDKGDGNFESMPKEVYEQRLADQEKQSGTL